MTITAGLPLAVLIGGLLVYGLTSHKTLGLIAFGCGLLVCVYMVAGHVVRLP